MSLLLPSAVEAAPHSRGETTVPVLNANQALWEKGDFTVIADCMRDSGEAVVRSLGIQPGQQVLDLGCGDGTTAVPLALLGAEVTGSTSRGTSWPPGRNGRASVA